MQLYFGIQMSPGGTLEATTHSCGSLKGVTWGRLGRWIEGPDANLREICAIWKFEK